MIIVAHMFLLIFNDSKTGDGFAMIVWCCFVVLGKYGNELGYEFGYEVGCTFQ